MLRLAASIMVLAVLTAIPSRANDLGVGQKAPPITLTTLDGKTFDTALLKGKVIIVTFWATWCEPCREELPLLSKYASEHASQDLIVLGFSLDSAKQIDQVRSVANQLSFPVGLLGDPHVPGYGRIWRLPVSFTIDREGMLVDNGWENKDPVWSADRLEKVVTPLLARR